MKKNILLVGGGPEISLYADTLKNNKRYIFYSISEIPTMYSDVFEKSLVVDFSNWGNVIEKIKDLSVHFNAVACLDEVMIHIADDIAKELELKPISELHCQPFRYKDRMRIVCESNNIKVPRYKIINSFSDTNKVINWKFPLIVKPTSFLASIGVKKVNNFTELQQVVSQLLNVKFPVYIGSSVYELGEIYNLEPRVLIEDYVEGDEYSLESIIVNGKYTPLGITKKITNEDLFMDEIGHIFPSKLDADLTSKIFDWGEKLHVALQLTDVTSHTEFRLNENNDPILIEIGARIGGDQISQLMTNSFESDFSFCEEYLNARLGEEIDINNKTVKYSGIVFIRIPKKCYGKKLSSITYDTGSLQSKIFEEKMNKQIGDILPDPISWSNERLGYICLENEKYDTLYEDMKNLINSIVINCENLY